MSKKLNGNILRIINNEPERERETERERERERERGSFSPLIIVQSGGIPEALSKGIAINLQFGDL